MIAFPEQDVSSDDELLLPLPPVASPPSPSLSMKRKSNLQQPISKRFKRPQPFQELQANIIASNNQNLGGFAQLLAKQQALYQKTMSDQQSEFQRLMMKLFDKSS